MKQSEKVLAGITVAIVSSVGLWSYVAQPTIDRWRAASEREETLKDKLGRWQALVNRGDELRVERKAIDDALRPPLDELGASNVGAGASGDAIAGFLSHLTSLTAAAGINPSTLRYVRSDPFDAFAELRFELKARAPLKQVHDFLVRMAASDWFLRVQSLSIVPRESGDVEADMSLVALASADALGEQEHADRSRRGK